MADQNPVTPPAAPTHLKIVPISSKHPSSTTWSPEQMLEEFLVDPRAGKIHPTNLMLFWLDRDPDGSLRPRRYIANVSRAEEIAFHALGTAMALDQWRNPT